MTAFWIGWRTCRSLIPSALVLFAKVRRLYAYLGIPERTAIEFFNGPHTINGIGTFEFLRRHLNWPPR